MAQCSRNMSDDATYIFFFQESDVFLLDVLDFLQRVLDHHVPLFLGHAETCWENKGTM